MEATRHESFDSEELEEVDYVPIVPQPIDFSNFDIRDREAT